MAAKRKTSTGMLRKRTRPRVSTQFCGGTGIASWPMSWERTKPKTKAPLASVAKIAGTSA